MTVIETHSPVSSPTASPQVRYALHRITDAERPGFSPADYSRFKYGDGDVAVAFGRQLAAGFLERYAELLREREEVVFVPPPFQAIPTAAHALGEAFRQNVNDALYGMGKASLLTSKIHRYKTYAADYGAMDAAQRLALISADAYHLDAAFLRDRLVVFLDDIRITGSHELIIRRQLDRHGVEGDFVFVYFAALDNPDVHPDFENHLNYYAVDSPEAVAELIGAGDFRLNTRVTKYILRLSADEWAGLLGPTDAAFRRCLLSAAIANDYHLMKEYRDNVARLHQLVHHGH